MPAKKTPLVKYTSRDFTSIRNDLIEHAKRYYPDNFKDFNEASFGSLMIDTVAYVGDVLSFYLDYQANETFIDTAIEYDNVLKIGNQLGYKRKGPPASFGIVTVYTLIPATSNGTPNTNFMPILRRGSSFTSLAGNQFELNEDINFSHPENEIVVAKVNADTGAPISFAVKAFGQVISGRMAQENISVGDFEKFLKVQLAGGRDITEIISVFDGRGNEYYEVEYLSQNTIHVPVLNRGAGSDAAKYILKPKIVPRRYTVERTRSRTHLRFGYGSETKINDETISEPRNVVLEQHGRNYVVDQNFDPSKLLQTDKFGIVPTNTTLTVTYRTNTNSSINSAANSITSVTKAILEFPNDSSVNNQERSVVRNSLEVTNESPILGEVLVDDIEELKKRIEGSFTTQNRAVTEQDYTSLVYSMDPKFGAIKRCRIMRDPDSFKRNLNLYVISEDTNGFLTTTNSIIKNNIKVWLNNYRMINDTIDILNARTVNIGIEFSIVVSPDANRFDTLRLATQSVKAAFSKPYDIGEFFYISDVFGVLKNVSGVIDVVDVVIKNKQGTKYSTQAFSVDQNLSSDGRVLEVDDDVVLEVKYPNLDIKGVIL